MAVSISSAASLVSIFPTIQRTTSPSSKSLSLSSCNSSSFRGNSVWVLNPKKTRSSGLSCKYLFGLGVPELVVIAGVAALVFGPNKLPEVGRSMGKTVKSFQQAAKEFEAELKKESDSVTEPPLPVGKAANSK